MTTIALNTLAEEFLKLWNEFVAVPVQSAEVKHKIGLGGINEQVSERDLAVSNKLLSLLRKTHPHSFSEEDGYTDGLNCIERRWCVDPIDGTDFFIMGKLAGVGIAATMIENRGTTPVPISAVCAAIDPSTNLVTAWYRNVGEEVWKFDGTSHKPSVQVAPQATQPLRISIATHYLDSLSGDLGGSSRVVEILREVLGADLLITDTQAGGSISHQVRLFCGQVDAAIMPDCWTKWWDVGPGMVLLPPLGGSVVDCIDGAALELSSVNLQLGKGLIYCASATANQRLQPLFRSKKWHEMVWEYVRGEESQDHSGGSSVSS